MQVLEAPSVRVFDDIQDLVRELVGISDPYMAYPNSEKTIIETILRQQRIVLEGSLTLFGTTAKSQDAFSLITLAKALQDIRKQLNNVTELLQLAQNKENIVRLPFFSISASPILPIQIVRLTARSEIVKSSNIHPQRNEQPSHPRLHHRNGHLLATLLHDLISRYE